MTANIQFGIDRLEEGSRVRAARREEEDVQHVGEGGGGEEDDGGAAEGGGAKRGASLGTASGAGAP